MKRFFQLLVLSLVMLTLLGVMTACGGGEGPSAPTETTYEVVFKSGDTVLKTETVVAGNAATAPEVPARDGYEFTGWDTAFDAVNGNMTVMAQYARLWTVTFVDANNLVIKKDYVRNGAAATAPEAVPAVDYCEFVAWDMGFNYVTEDIVVKAMYADRGIVTVIFRDHDGSVIGTDSVFYGEDATAPAAPAHEGCTFVGWDAAFDNVTSHITVTALCRENGKHLVRFVDHDGTTLRVESVAEGDAATAPAAPSRVNYNFSGWDKALDGITADTVITATYTEKVKHTVTFKGHDGKVVATVEVYDGGTAQEPPSPVRNRYIFTGWDVELGPITEDCTITAKYALLRHNVVFYTQGGTEIPSQQIVDGSLASKPADPVRTGYTFVEWRVDGKTYTFKTAVKADVNVYAIFEPNGTVPTATNKNLAVTPDVMEVWLGLSLRLDITAGSKELGFIDQSGASFDFISTDPAVIEVDDKGNFKALAIGTAQVYAIAKSSGSTGGYSVSSGDVLAASTITVVDVPEYYQKALEDENQKVTLGSTTRPRIDKEDYLSYPTAGYGAANVSLWFNDTQAALAMTVDDNHNVSGEWEQWDAWRETYGIPVTFTVYTARLGQYTADGKIWKDIIASGNDVHTHGADHIRIGENTSTARVWYDMYYGQKQLMKIAGANGLAIGYANGTNYAPISEMLFIGGRGTYGTPSEVETLNYNQTNSYSGFGTGAQSMMDSLFGNGNFANGFLSVHYHEIGDADVEQSYIIIKPYIDDGRLWAANFAAVMQYGQERDTATVFATSATPNAITLTVTDEMNDLLFYHPLSVRVQVNAAWKNVRAFQNGEEISSRIVEKDGKTYVLVNAVPDMGEVTLLRANPENGETYILRAAEMTAGEQVALLPERE